MEKQYSKNEVNDFIARFKQKKMNKFKKPTNLSQNIEKKEEKSIINQKNGNQKEIININNDVVSLKNIVKVNKGFTSNNKDMKEKKISNKEIKKEISNTVNYSMNKKDKKIDLDDLFKINENDNNEIENIFQINKNKEKKDNDKKQRNMLNIKAINSNNIKNTNLSINIKSSRNIEDNKKNIEKKNIFVNKNKNNNVNSDYNNINTIKINKDKEQISLLRNIYDSFSNNLNISNKENIFNSNILNDDLQILDLNYEESLERKKRIITNNNNYEKHNIQENKTDNDYNKNMNSINDINENIRNHNIIENKYNKNENYCNISKDYIIKYKKEERKISLENIYHLLYRETEYFIYKNYFPVSYDNNLDLTSYNNLLSLLINKNDDILEPTSSIIALLLQNIFSYNINLKEADFLKNEKLKKDIMEILFNYIQKKYNYQNEKIINNDNLLFLFNQKKDNNNIFNIFMKYDLLNNLNTPLDFIIQLYKNSIMNKNTIIYYYFLLLNIEENNLNNLNSSEQLEEIFSNFEICLYIILKYINTEYEIKKICQILVNSCCAKMLFSQYIILKMIIGEHDITDEKFYGKLFTSFLNFVTIEKLMIADFYNLILYTINVEVKKIFAKSSIVIKYKYSLLKKQYEESQKNLILRQKIYENIEQFGKISKNYYFMKYIKEEFCNMEKNNNNTIEETLLEHNNEILGEKEMYVERNNDHQESNNDNEEGLFSTIKFTLGFGRNKYENNNDD